MSCGHERLDVYRSAIEYVATVGIDPDSDSDSDPETESSLATRWGAMNSNAVQARIDSLHAVFLRPANELAGKAPPGRRGWVQLGRAPSADFTPILRGDGGLDVGGGTVW